jgi:hypothetical protein
MNALKMQLRAHSIQQFVNLYLRGSEQISPTVRIRQGTA